MGNRKKINIWNDKVLGLTPIDEANFPNIKLRMQEMGYKKLYDISSWDNSGNWKEWKLLQPPEHLDKEHKTFTSLLHGGSPSNIQDRDIKGWGINGHYIVKEGFKIIKRNDGNQKANIWNKVWNLDCIPKFNIFFWLLAQNKLLTADNFRKRVKALKMSALCHP